MLLALCAGAVFCVSAAQARSVSLVHIDVSPTVPVPSMAVRNEVTKDTATIQPVSVSTMPVPNPIHYNDLAFDALVAHNGLLVSVTDAKNHFSVSTSSAEYGNYNMVLNAADGSDTFVVVRDASGDYYVRGNEVNLVARNNSGSYIVYGNIPTPDASDEVFITFAASAAGKLTVACSSYTLNLDIYHMYGTADSAVLAKSDIAVFFAIAIAVQSDSGKPPAGWKAVTLPDWFHVPGKWDTQHKNPWVHELVPHPMNPPGSDMGNGGSHAKGSAPAAKKKDKGGKDDGDNSDGDGRSGGGGRGGHGHGGGGGGGGGRGGHGGGGYGGGGYGGRGRSHDSSPRQRQDFGHQNRSDNMAMADQQDGQSGDVSTYADDKSGKRSSHSGSSHHDDKLLASARTGSAQTPQSEDGRIRLEETMPSGREEPSIPDHADTPISAREPKTSTHRHGGQLKMHGAKVAGSAVLIPAAFTSFHKPSMQTESAPAFLRASAAAPHHAAFKNHIAARAEEPAETIENIVAPITASPILVTTAATATAAATSGFFHFLLPMLLRRRGLAHILLRQRKPF